ncbi:MAG: four-carbon acid sugar kinase family protein [Desulfobacterales bacterium]|jgi:uncharacterized protein YgbK (DUF1537 family)
MNQIVIIADDLTGAADTGVQFCRFYDDVVLRSFLHLPESRSLDAGPATAIYTNSRSLEKKAAGNRLRSVACRLKKFELPWIYKKIDSCLRGNPGAETEALLDELAYDVSFIAPAFPEMGRTTVDGTHLVHGIPLGQTEISRDPVTPVTESGLRKIIESQCRYPVGHIDLNFLDGEETVIRDEIEGQIRAGTRHIVFDATSRKHLDRIAHLSHSTNYKILPVGSAGLAAGFDSFWSPKIKLKKNHHRFVVDGRHLIVSGTNSAVTARQISALVEKYPHERIALDPCMLIDQATTMDVSDKVAKVRRKLSTQHTIITINSSEHCAAAPQPQNRQPSAHLIVKGLGRFLSTGLADIRPAVLFLTGGDTADAIITAIGAKGIRLVGELLTGVVQGRLMGGLMNGLPVVTKAGAFGAEDTLVVLHEMLIKKS